VSKHPQGGTRAQLCSCLFDLGLKASITASKHSLCVVAISAAQLCHETFSLKGSPAGPQHILAGGTPSHSKQRGPTDLQPKGEEITPPGISPGGGTQRNTLFLGKNTLCFVP